MVREIVKDPIFLARKSVPATRGDFPIGRDLLDTLAAHREECVGMAANMIGVSKNIIVFDDNGTPFLMFNPEIIRFSDAYETEEGCLSLTGKRPVKRWKHIKVRWQNEDFQVRIKTFSDFTAEIIQHEIDHCNGILI